jgi:hypothetical protein
MTYIAVVQYCPSPVLPENIAKAFYVSCEICNLQSVGFSVLLGLYERNIILVNYFLLSAFRIL